MKSRFKYELIAEARKKKFLTQKKLADLVGVQESMLQSWEYGKQTPNDSNLKKLLLELDLSENDIVEILDETESRLLPFKGENISLIREQKGLSQRQLAQKMNVHFQTIYRWENNFFVPSAENQRKLSEILNCDRNEFYDERN